jgi:hypothetical protein
VSEWNITANVTITPSDIHAVQQNNARSLLQMAVQVDTDIFYIRAGRPEVAGDPLHRHHRLLTSIDASLLAEHLIATHRVKQGGRALHPEVFWCCCATTASRYS